MKYCTYITANKPNGVLYTGQTHELKDRISSHKNKKYNNSFSARYNVDNLVWYKEFDNILDAREMEKKIKSGSRAKKIKLLEEPNPEWKDLFNEF